ncbi:hypothetical protein ACFL6C_02235 [Myxococcota bacterium]
MAQFAIQPLPPPAASLTRYRTSSHPGSTTCPAARTDIPGFGCQTSRCHLDGSTYGLSGLAGLYLGVAAGALFAAHTEVTLERVRATTLFGYGGALLGGLIGANNAEDEGAGRGIALGGALVLVIGALATRSLDGLPDDAITLSDATSLAPSLTVMPLVDRTGAVVPT